MSDTRDFKISSSAVATSSVSVDAKPNPAVISAAPSSKFEELLKSLDSILIEKYTPVTIKLDQSYSDQEFDLLTKRLEQLDIQWGAAISLNEINEIRERLSKESIEEKQINVSWDQFEQFKQAPHWDLQIDATHISSAFKNFVLMHIQKKIQGLILKKPIDEKFMDQILAIGNRGSALRSISFLYRQQVISDAQAKKIVTWIEKSDFCAHNLPGENISNETADQFLALPKETQWIIDGCAYLDKRQYNLVNLSNIPLDGLGGYDYEFSARDIILLTNKMKAGKKHNRHLQINIFSELTFALPEWKYFFSYALSANEYHFYSLTISRGASINEEVMQAIAVSIGKNHTLEYLTLYNLLSDDVVTQLAVSFASNKNLKEIELRLFKATYSEKIIDALSNHPTLTGLVLNHSYCGDDIGEFFQRLLCGAPRLKRLMLGRTGIGDKTIKAMARAYEPKQPSLNKDQKSEILQKSERSQSLQELILFENYAITSEGMKTLAEMLFSNQSLTLITLYQNNVTPVGLAYLASRLVSNYTLTDLGYSWDEKDNKAMIPINSLINKVLDRNKRIAPFIKEEKNKSMFGSFTETAIVLGQAARQSHRVWKTFDLFEYTLAFLVPPFEQVRGYRCIKLVFENLFSKDRKWKTSLEGCNGRSIPVFQRWSIPTEEYKAIQQNRGQLQETSQPFQAERNLMPAAVTPAPLATASSSTIGFFKDEPSAKEASSTSMAKEESLTMQMARQLVLNIKNKQNDKTHESRKIALVIIEQSLLSPTDDEKIITAIKEAKKWVIEKGNLGVSGKLGSNFLSMVDDFLKSYYQGFKSSSCVIQ